MSNFREAFEFMIKNEGGYILHKVEGDRGGQTYAGIARNFWPKWEGWGIIDDDDMDNPQLTGLVRDFYRKNFWDKIHGDEILNDEVSTTIFDFAVNAGVKIASKLAQIVVGATPDGMVGKVTVSEINTHDPNIFMSNYALAKLARYKQICRRNPSQKKFLYGWVTRLLKGVV